LARKFENAFFFGRESLPPSVSSRAQRSMFRRALNATSVNLPAPPAQSPGFCFHAGTNLLKNRPLVFGKIRRNIWKEQIPDSPKNGGAIREFGSSPAMAPACPQERRPTRLAQSCNFVSCGTVPFCDDLWHRPLRDLLLRGFSNKPDCRPKRLVPKVDIFAQPPGNEPQKRERPWPGVCTTLPKLFPFCPWLFQSAARHLGRNKPEL